MSKRFLKVKGFEVVQFRGERQRRSVKFSVLWVGKTRVGEGIEVRGVYVRSSRTHQTLGVSSTHK